MLPKKEKQAQLIADIIFHEMSLPINLGVSAKKTFGPNLWCFYRNQTIILEHYCFLSARGKNIRNIVYGTTKEEFVKQLLERDPTQFLHGMYGKYQHGSRRDT